MPFSGRGRSNAAVSIAEVAETVCRSSSPARKSVASALTPSASERNSSAETCSGGIESSLTDATLRDNGTSILASLPPLLKGPRERGLFVGRRGLRFLAGELDGQVRTAC